MKKPHEIYVLNKALSLQQPEKGFRTCMDSILLAAACPITKNGRVLDLGCGVGGAGLCVMYRVQHTHLTGIDIQDDHIEIAKKNAKKNNMADRTTFLQADVRTYKTAHVFQHVICNPPYMQDGAHLSSRHAKKALAHGTSTDLTDWVDCAYRSLEPGGSFTIIHQAEKTDKIIQKLSSRFGAIEIIPLWPKENVKAKRVIIRSLKDRKTPCTLSSGLILHRQDGQYTDETQQILRRAEPLK